MKFKEFIKDVEDTFKVVSNILKLHKIPIKVRSYKKDSISKELYKFNSINFYIIEAEYKYFDDINSILAKMFKREIASTFNAKGNASLDFSTLTKSMNCQLEIYIKDSDESYKEKLEFIKSKGINILLSDNKDLSKSTFYIDSKEDMLLFTKLADKFKDEGDEAFFFLDRLIIRRVKKFSGFSEPYEYNVLAI